MSMQSISVRELFEKSQHQPVDLIDVRSPAEFQGVHSQLAENVPLDSLDPQKVQASRNGTSDQPLYLICKMGGRSAKACEQFLAAGIANVVNVQGGTDAWVQAGLPVNQSAQPKMSLERQVRITSGCLVTLGAMLGLFVHPYLIAISAAVGIGMVFSGITNTCGMGLLISKMPWNQPGGC